MLFRWAGERADAEGALIYLEATDVGISLYERFGCEAVDDGVVEFEGGGRRVCMLRKPKGG